MQSDIRNATDRDATPYLNRLMILLTEVILKVSLNKPIAIWTKYCDVPNIINTEKMAFNNPSISDALKAL